MTPTEFASLIRFYTGTNSSTLTDANILILANQYKDKLAEEIVKKDEDIFGMKFTRNLLANIREYALPDELIKLKYLEVKLDGSEQERMDETDLAHYKGATDETSIIEAYTGRKPAFDIFRKSIWIYSGDAIIDVTGGLIMHGIIYPANLTTLSSSTDMSAEPSTTSFGIPRQLHSLLVRRVSIAYKKSRPKPLPLSEDEQEVVMTRDLGDALASISGFNLDRSELPSTPYDDGQDY
jgi:hypothetical protein